MLKQWLAALGLLLLCFVPFDAGQAAQDEETYSKEEIAGEIESFFSETSQGLGRVLEKAFSEMGRPVGYIFGTEGGGAAVVGLRYGEGLLRLKSGPERTVYWQGPSLGYDFGGNAAKVFTLVYGLTGIEAIFQRYPGLEGSAYFVGGFSMNYHRRDGVTLVPIRSGVGFRLGANLGYLHFTRVKRINPF